MGLRILTNTSSQRAVRTLKKKNDQYDNSLKKLSTGYRINSGADDITGLAISEKLKSKIKSYRMADRNAIDGISFVQTASGSLNDISAILIRLRELSMQSATDTVNNVQRSFLNKEFEYLKSEINRVAKKTEFNGRKLLDGSKERYEFQIGIKDRPSYDRIIFDTKKLNATVESIGPITADIKSKKKAQKSLKMIDGAINKISEKKTIIGALENRLQTSSSVTKKAGDNSADANGKIRDTDVAIESSENAKLTITRDAATSVLIQANNAPRNAIKLIES